MGLVRPAKKIVESLSARGIVILSAEAPVVLCVVDWVEIANGAHDLWRKLLAEAAGTTVDRVALHTHHPHDTPGHFFSRDEMEDFKNLDGIVQDTAFAEKTASRTAAALRASLPKAKPVTHYGYGCAEVAEVASNRRIIGEDGRVAHWRGSACNDKAIRDLPEGVIDPWLRNISFWNGEQPLVSITYYATHPQSFYGEGAVSPDFTGLARSIREATLPDVAHIHFDGAGGNVAAGKYNDRSPQNRLILAQRLVNAMETAWAGTKKAALNDSEFSWRVKPLALPVRETLAGESEKHLLSILHDKNRPDVRILFHAAGDLVWKRRRQAGRTLDVGCLKIGETSILHMPGELFVEYQLAAQKMAGERPVMVAAYGDCGTGYIGTGVAYRQGGYETGDASRVSQDSERIILETMRCFFGTSG